jgi:malate dehydrogenase (oxaloacetate-decarboxylating)(NADP+)
VFTFFLNKPLSVLTGLGLGAILSRASQITDSMVEASSLGLAKSLTDEEVALDLLYPRIERSTFHAALLTPFHSFKFHVASVRDISAHIAKQVVRKAQKAVSFSCLLRLVNI